MIDVLDRKCTDEIPKSRTTFRFKRRYFKNNAEYFRFIDRHPELKIENVVTKNTTIVVQYSKRLGRPKKKIVENR